MAEKTFHKEFEGYWRDQNSSSLPIYSGVYIVQSCIYNKKEDTVSLKKLIYIGKADDVNDRINNHEKRNDWIKELKDGEELCYNCTNINTLENERVEAALINMNQPSVNKKYKNSFPFDRTTVNSSGKYSNIIQSITIERH